MKSKKSKYSKMSNMAGDNIGDNITAKDVIDKFKSIVAKYCDKNIELFKPDDKGRKRLEFCISQNEDNHFIITLTLNHGPFNDMQKKYERLYYKIEYVDEQELTNFLFNALTFKLSPFYFENGKFIKQIECL